MSSRDRNEGEKSTWRGKRNSVGIDWLGLRERGETESEEREQAGGEGIIKGKKKLS